MEPTRELLEILSWARPHGSADEQAFVKLHVADLAPKRDGFGNHFLRIGAAPVLWSCHTDTVDHTGGRKKITVSGDGIVRLVDGRAGRCLGADDGAGIWLMREMIRAEIPGLYVFHRGEERGGLGSSWLAKNQPAVLRTYKYAIAFDRKGTTSIITHQAGLRCCSDAFAWALGRKLGPMYMPDDGGVFTDTANYVDLVPECTNVSAGYEREHGPTETLDAAYLFQLRDALCSIDTSDLPCERDPRVVEDLYDTWMPGRSKAANYVKEYDEDDLEEVVYNNPTAVAAFLREYGLSAADVLEFVQGYHDRRRL